MKLSSLTEEIGFLTSRKHRSFYIGWLGHKNLGDEILHEAIIGLLGDGIRYYEKKYVGKVVRRLSNAFHSVILGGGTIINREDDGILNMFRDTVSGKKVVFGSGVANPLFWSSVPGSYSNPRGWADALNGADYIAVRGPYSKALLTEWGVQREVVMFGDPALQFLTDQIHRKKRRKVLGINIGDTNNLLWGRSDFSFYNRLLGAIKRLVTEGWSFKFFPVCPKDLPIIKKMMSALNGCDTHMVENYLDRNCFMDELQDVDVFVGEKLHATILAICSCTPSIMLEYRPKCRDFMASIGMEKYNLRTDEIDTKTLCDTVDDLYAKQWSIQTELFERCTVLKRLQISEAQKVRSLLDPLT